MIHKLSVRAAKNHRDSVHERVAAAAMQPRTSVRSMTARLVGRSPPQTPSSDSRVSSDPTESVPSDPRFSDPWSEPLSSDLGLEAPLSVSQGGSSSARRFVAWTQKNTEIQVDLFLK